MPAFTASAPGKIILFGEHAVVYGQPAIAVPVMQLQARATVMPTISASPTGVRILAPDVGLDAAWAQLSPQNPIGAALASVLSTLGIARLPACTVKVTSSIPIASGLGSGAAVSVAVIRACAGFLGEPLSDKAISALAYEIEKIHHGTPSGIDNTVVTYAQPVYFIKGMPFETFAPRQPFTLIIGDTGIPAPTKEAVSDVRQAWETDPQTYNRWFAVAGSIVKTARQAIAGGYPERLGPLMNENHEVLQKIGVSSPELDELVDAAKAAGAWGAKLSGGGRGGNMIALVDPRQADIIATALRHAGAAQTIITEVGA